MAKQSTRNNRMGIFALEFVGSLFYLGVIFSIAPVAYANAAWSGSAALWEPLLYAAATVSAIALFFISFGNLGKAFSKCAAQGAMYSAIAGGFSLVALTAGNPAMFIASLIGFVLAFVGSGLAYSE